MGEGNTPMLVAAPHLYLKLEFLSPTGSFKDRGAVALVAGAVEHGAERLIADSSGNAGSAIAAYATRAGLPCTVFVPESTSPGKVAQISGYGATVERVPGDRTASEEAAIAEVERTGATYASHVRDPMFLEGTKTFAFEVAEQLGRAPDSVLIPVGNGTLLLGAAQGFRELLAAGRIDRLPALIGLQSERCAPLVRAWGADLDTPAEIEAEETAAEGIAIPRPARGGEILAAVRESDGRMVSVPEAAIAPATRELARRGLLVEPTAAVVWAARDQAIGTTVVPLCGSGLKNPPLV
jgi:threonine synthase